MASTETDARAALAICQSLLLLLVEQRLLAGEDVRQVLEDAADALRRPAADGGRAGDDEPLETAAQTIIEIANSVVAATPAEPPRGGRTRARALRRD